MCARQVEFGLPDLEGRAGIFQIHARSMNCERDIRFELLARLCPNTTGADIRSVCIEAGMYAIRARRKTVTEKDMIEAVNKVIKGYSKFSATPKYLVYVLPEPTHTHTHAPPPHRPQSRIARAPSRVHHRRRCARHAQVQLRRPRRPVCFAEPAADAVHPWLVRRPPDSPARRRAVERTIQVQEREADGLGHTRAQQAARMGMLRRLGCWRFRAFGEGR